MDAFHVYKNQLMREKAADLPVQLCVNDPNHFDLLLRTLRHHPSTKQKIGEGLKEIIVRRSTATNGEDVCCCYVVRIDGSEEDFSLFKCYNLKSWKDKGRHFDASTDTLLKRDTE